MHLEPNLTLGSEGLGNGLTHRSIHKACDGDFTDTLHSHREKASV